VPASKIHDDWIKSFEKKCPGGKAKGVQDLYYAMLRHAPARDVFLKVHRQSETVSWDLLRKGIEALSSGPEAYLLIRAQFARTLAAFSVGSYIIGIGDRHLDNFLLNFKNGGLIGIDFGHAFGTATQFLPIPELMPFRLTRQFTNFLLPLDCEGIY
jgi:DNA-dependent protein kinase catalytic subunit